MQLTSYDNDDFQLHLFIKGHVKGFDYFFESLYKPLCYFASKIVATQEIAEELADDAFIKLWERHDQFESVNGIRSFLYRTTRNACLNYLRNTKTRNLHEYSLQAMTHTSEADIQQHIIRAETIQQVHQAFTILPKKCREVFNLIYLENKNYEEIAKELQISVDNVRNHKKRALQLLRGHFGKSLFTAMLMILLFA